MCFSWVWLQRDVEVLRNRIAELQADVRARARLSAYTLRTLPMCACLLGWPIAAMRYY